LPVENEQLVAEQGIFSEECGATPREIGEGRGQEGRGMGRGGEATEEPIREGKEMEQEGLER
jgi:hypothetical protein